MATVNIEVEQHCLHKHKLANTTAALEHAQKRRKAWHIGANEKAIFSQR